MLSKEDLQQIAAQVFGWPPDKATDLSPVGRTSFDKAKLAAVLERRLGRKVPAVHTARTLGELQAQLSGDGAGPAPAPPAVPANDRVALTAISGLRCGIDIEPVSSLPQVTDYWEDPFYKATFSPTETAYCLTQEKPHMHFAARWCAKEALRKCDPRYQNVDAAMIELVTTAGEGIYLRLRTADGEEIRLPHAVSVTHTLELAAATVVMISPA